MRCDAMHRRHRWHHHPPDTRWGGAICGVGASHRIAGVNWAILVVWVSKRNPDAPASKLLQLFFRTFANWSWPNQVVLSSDQKQPPKGVQPLPVWDPTENYRDKKALMPII